MSAPSDEEIAGLLTGIISDGFNRSFGALRDAGAVDDRKMRRHYAGIGSKYYDLVTEQIELTARYGAPAIRKLFVDSASTDWRSRQRR